MAGRSLLTLSPNSQTPVASLFLLRTIVVVNVVIAFFLYCTSIIYSAIRLSSRKCVIYSLFSVQNKQQGRFLPWLLRHAPSYSTMSATFLKAACNDEHNARNPTSRGMNPK